MKQLGFIFVLLGLASCSDFMSPDKMAVSVEAEERCNAWQEQTKKETTRFGMDYTLFNRACILNKNETQVLGYEGQYETGNSREDKKIRSTWKVVTTFELSKN